MLDRILSLVILVGIQLQAKVREASYTIYRYLPPRPPVLLVRVALPWVALFLSEVLSRASKLSQLPPRNPVPV